MHAYSEGEESGAAKFIRSGNKSPIPTYFIGCDGGESCDELLALLEASPESNIKYLGRCGVVSVHPVLVLGDALHWIGLEFFITDASHALFCVAFASLRGRQLSWGLR